ncbi:MAG: hypothetical protein QOG79_6321 [Mycobacterium sp.]|nr:hypothetical protein [Mycobacterium sp.]
MRTAAGHPVPVGIAALLMALLVTCSCDRDSATSVTTVVFDGKTQTITGEVLCSTQPDGKLLILVNQDGGRKTVRVVLRQEPRLVVERAGLRYLDVAGFVADSGEVVATKVDNTYTFSGRMPPNEGERQWHLFTIETTCAYVQPAEPPGYHRSPAASHPALLGGEAHCAGGLEWSARRPRG